MVKFAFRTSVFFITLFRECLDNQVFSSPGAFGFYPWIDRVNDYYAILGRYDPSVRNPAAFSVLTGTQLQPLIIKALRQVHILSKRNARLVKNSG